jgi:iron(III) transport system ATP-binding protein
MLREEEIQLQPDHAGSVVIRDRQFLGREYRYCLETATGQRIHARTSLDIAIPVGSAVNVTLTNPSPPIFAEQIPA